MSGAWAEWSDAVAQCRRFFCIQELVSPARFKARGDLAWRDLRLEVIQGLTRLREDFGCPITVNNWHMGGSRVNSGLRDGGAEVGATFSAHLIGAALDAHADDLTGLRHLVVRNHAKYGVTETEDAALAPGWLHASWRATGLSGLYVIKKC